MTDQLALFQVRTPRAALPPKDCLRVPSPAADAESPRAYTQAWHPHPCIPTLADLRDAVLSLGHRRKPKWQFRLASDLLVQLQPWNEPVRTLPPEYRAALAATEHGAEIRAIFDTHAVTYTRLFHGEAIVGREDASGFGIRLPAGPPYVTLEFCIDAQEAAWYFHLNRCRHFGPGPDDSWAAVVTAMRRAQAALAPARFAVLHPEMMLRPTCLFCGKALTDPASKARWVGPECAGTSSLRVPGIRDLVNAC